MGDPLASFGLPVSVGFALGLLVVPPLLHLWTGWRLRRSEIVGQLSPRGIRLYFQQFRPAVVLKEEGEQLRRRFEKQYGESYGKRHYAFPLVMLALVGGFLLWLVLRFGIDSVTNAGAKDELPVLAVGAVAGAYVWVTWDLIRRCHSRELAPLDINRATLRLMAAIPLGYAFTANLGDQAVFLAFLLAAVPFDTLSTWARKQVTARFEQKSDDEPVSDLTKLDGITKEIAERLRDVGVSTINQLAFIDPIDLAIRTNLEMNYVTDCVSQALAYDYLKDDMQHARRYFLRGAVEINSLMSDLCSSKAVRQGRAQLTLQRLADDLHLESEILRRQLEVEVCGDAHTQFLSDLQLTNASTDVKKSTMSAKPRNVPADGTTEVELKVTLKSADGREVRGEAVNITTDHDVVILPDPIARTDQDGEVCFTITSGTPGTATLTATDIIEGLKLEATATVTFDAVPVQPGPAAPHPAAVALSHEMAAEAVQKVPSAASMEADPQLRDRG